MGRLIVQMQTSMDGFVSSTVPGSTWQLWNWGPDWPWSPDLRRFFNDVFDSVSGVILSRPMVAEGYLGHWKRTAELRPDDPDYRFARRIGELPKFVISSRSLDSRWPNTTVVTADISDAVRRAKTETSGDLVCFGGAGFVNAALRRDLVDELQLFINPGIAGAGTRIFDSSMTTRSYELADAVPYECGIVVGRWTRPTVA